jgi:hypothetical protein
MMAYHSCITVFIMKTIPMAKKLLTAAEIIQLDEEPGAQCMRKY